MIGKNLRDLTYNDIAFMSFGEAQALKHQIDELVYERDQLNDVAYEQAYEIAVMKGEIHE